jgi:hypothetical protein
VSVEEEGKLIVQRLRRDYEDAAEFKERFGFDPVEDKQLKAATDMLRGVLAMAPAKKSAIASSAK